MGNYVDKETSYGATILLTFRQGLQQEFTAQTRLFYNNKDFNNLYSTELPCAPDCSFLSVVTQVLCDQLLTSRLKRQKNRLDNCIAFCVERPQSDMVPYDNETNASTNLILHRTEWDKDYEESSDDEELNLDNQEFYSTTKRKRSTSARDLPTHHNKQIVWNTLSSPFLYETVHLCKRTQT